MDKLQNSTTNLNGYAHFVAFADYENKISYFHDFKLLELSTNSSILAGKPAYKLIGTYELHSSVLHKLMETGTIIVIEHMLCNILQMHQTYLPTVQKMIDSLVIKKSIGTGNEAMLDKQHQFASIQPGKVS